ncbi:MAG: hypothetical protein A2Z20_01855 [Bdellovibrionales bacterium RBG_16_40_8]|nr:MAG: hypothetical protein A2Z20_01855 [Bdellovibrionales bacterium RBG_16_40_8]
MKCGFYFLRGKTSAWAEAAAEEYTTKISNYIPFKREGLKSKLAERSKFEEKRRAEAEAILSKINPRDFVILFDESGRAFKNSIEFSREIVKTIESGANRLVFIIGGPYGFDERVTAVARARWSLSLLTMNHHVAQIAALEQIYRALTIWKGVPYHN